MIGTREWSSSVGFSDGTAPQTTKYKNEVYELVWKTKSGTIQIQFVLKSRHSAQALRAPERNA